MNLELTIAIKISGQQVPRPADFPDIVVIDMCAAMLAYLTWVLRIQLRSSCSHSKQNDLSPQPTEISVLGKAITFYMFKRC